MAEQQPSLWLLAGPNGSGKSTFYQQKLSTLIPVYVNPDEIAKTLTSVDLRDRDRKAMDLAEQQRLNLIAAGETFVAETVFSHPSKVDLIREAKASGYWVNLVFICTDDPVINLARVQDRVALGGHDVPVDKIAPRYERSLQNLREAVLIADRTLLYDNSIAKAFHHLTAEIQQGVATQYDVQLPAWVTKAFPEGLQPYLDAHLNALERILRQAVQAMAGETLTRLGESRLYYVENSQEKVYCVVAPHDSAQEKAELVVMARIVDDVVVVEFDKSLPTLYDRLLGLGVTDDRIRLAWHERK